jgi:hypothetical protein
MQDSIISFLWDHFSNILSRVGRKEATPNTLTKVPTSPTLVTVNYNIQILSENPQYNFIVLYTDNNDT